MRSAKDTAKGIIDRHILGTLSLKIVRGKLYRDTEFIGKMNPFVTVDIQGAHFKTKVQEHKGKHPEWKETFEIQVLSMKNEILITCIDEELISNDVIG